MNERRAERLVAALFGLASLAGIALLVLYAAGGQTQLEAILLAAALGGIGLGIVLWAHHLLPDELVVAERHPLATPPQPDPPEAEAATRAITRRTLLVRTLGGAFAALGAGLAVPVLSLGPAPSGPNRPTGYRAGVRLVGLDGQPLKAQDLPVDGVATVFPDGAVGSAIGQTVVVRVDPGLLRLPADRAAWAPQGYVAYSKLCTHAGCPVGLYRAEEHRLLCPCHQSTFDVLDGAKPVFGPAARPLPQLPIQLQPDGTIVALDDFPEPVGPSVWNLTQHG
ncbi:MAG TPA: Rieske 2Fe-2S domain-containing protein [Candidatus Limnocylindrales bacterium]|jgi:ubiquinol-cytochrome c reductase iron-sulfur subunit